MEGVESIECFVTLRRVFTPPKCSRYSCVRAFNKRVTSVNKSSALRPFRPPCDSNSFYSNQVEVLDKSSRSLVGNPRLEEIVSAKAGSVVELATGFQLYVASRSRLVHSLYIQINMNTNVVY